MSLTDTHIKRLKPTKWSAFNLAEQEWRIPVVRRKMKQVHIVPLSRQAVRILEELRAFSGSGKYLFPSIRTDVRPISDVILLNALRHMGYEKHKMCTHGFCSLVSRLLNEFGYNRDWIERQLAYGEHNDVQSAIIMLNIFRKDGA